MIDVVAATHGDRYILRGLATFDLSPGQTASTSTHPDPFGPRHLA
jgi:hypothetical protein